MCLHHVWKEAKTNGQAVKEIMTPDQVLSSLTWAWYERDDPKTAWPGRHGAAAFEKDAAMLHVQLFSKGLSWLRCVQWYLCYS